MPSHPFRRPAPARTYQNPRISIFHVIRRTVMRLVELQVWDVAGSMTFYALLSVLPALISVVSLVSLLGLADETVQAAAGLVHEILPAVDPQTVTNALLALANTSGGVVGFVLGLAGAIIVASNAVAAFHRAMHSIHDTREGRPLLWFRTIVFCETVLLMIAVILLLLGVLIGGGLSQQLGQLLGVTDEAIAAWNLLKWPVILAVLVIVVSLAYYHAPNVQLPRYRVMSVGGIVTVLVLFASTLLLGWLIEYWGTFQLVLGALNGAIVVLLLIWLGFIVLVAGAALDAELLRARQLAAGLPAWHTLQLRTRHTRVLKFLDAFALSAQRTAQLVARNAREGGPVTVPASPRLAEAGSRWAVDDTDDAVTTGTPYSRFTTPESTPGGTQGGTPEGTQGTTIETRQKTASDDAAPQTPPSPT